jgi:nicotinate-nucleotide adenylyltransferase
MADGSGRKRLGVMGGTFDPIHNGHLVAAEEACWQFDLDEIIFVPAGQPWQKRDVSPAEDRYMRFSVARIEIDRGGPTYTLDTIRVLRSFYDDRADIFFVTGADAVSQILTWKDPNAVLDEAHFIAASRPEYDLSGLDLDQFGGRVSRMEIPALSISSTDIRRRVSEGRPISYLVPREVAGYIAERGLYRIPAGEPAA